MQRTLTFWWKTCSRSNHSLTMSSKSLHLCSTWFHLLSSGNCCSRPRGTSQPSNATNDQSFYEAKNAYRKCISANGIMASTAKKVNTCMFPNLSCRSIALICYEATSSKLLLNGHTPGEAFPALNNSCTKAHIIKSEKIALSGNL